CQHAPRGSGPQAPPRRAVMASKRRRLSRSAEFERVYRQGRSKANRFLVLYAFPREDDESAPDAACSPPASDAPQLGDAAAAEAEGPRLGLSVSRRVGGAVDRTRVKSVLREVLLDDAECLLTRRHD